MKQELNPKVILIAIGVLVLVLLGIGWKLFVAEPSGGAVPPGFFPHPGAQRPSSGSLTPLIPGGINFKPGTTFTPGSAVPIPSGQK